MKEELKCKGEKKTSSLEASIYTFKEIFFVICTNCSGIIF